MLVVLASVLAIAQFLVPRRYAFVPLLIGICHFQNIPVVQIGAAFSTCKIVIIAGLLRAARERRLSALTRQPMDTAFFAWAAWMLISGMFHRPPDHNPITIRLSVIFDFLGGYLYARCFVGSREDFLRMLRVLGLILIPLALEALAETRVLKNYYDLLYGGSGEITIRGARVRASGPFEHPILLGTFAASVMVMLLPLWWRDRKAFWMGELAGAATVFSSASSGPILTFMSGVFGVAIWRWRRSVGRIRAAIIGLVVLLHLMMQAPVWYLMARIDLAGGSTGWHRAELITAALNHLNEWWLIGSDYTRHWIAYGVYWSPYHIDVTNEYILMGITGGLPLVLCFVFILARAFQVLGKGLRRLRKQRHPDEFVLWCVGAVLFAHCFTFLSITYFDQNGVAFAVLLGCIPGLALATSARAASAKPLSSPEAGA